MPPKTLTLTTIKSPLIPDTLLRCQSCRSSQRNCATMSPCEAEDKASLLNEIQVHNSNASVHLTFLPSLSNPPTQWSRPASNPVHTQALTHLLALFSLQYRADAGESGVDSAKQLQESIVLQNLDQIQNAQAAVLKTQYRERV